MKIYLYNRDTGLYEGEDFRDQASCHEEEGVTTIAPPDPGPGEVPVYDREMKVWKLVAISSLTKIGA